jgi:hypothetical protein
MLRIILNSLKHIYYGSPINLFVANIDRFLRSRKIEKMIKDRGDTILSNRSFIGKTYYTTKLPGKNNPLCYELHEGAYKFFAIYTTQQQLDEMHGFCSGKDELESLMNILYEAEAKNKARREIK